MCELHITLKCFQGLKKVIWLDIGLKVSMFGERNSCLTIARYQELAQLENLTVEKSRPMPGHVV